MNSNIVHVCIPLVLVPFHSNSNGWNQNECESFLTEHIQMGDGVAVAEELKTQYEAFLESIEVSLQPGMHSMCIVRCPRFRRKYPGSP